jgi:hypothetical protein
MKLSHERCVHLSHLLINALEDEESVDFLSEVNEIRLRLLKILESEIVKEDEMEESIRRRIAAQRRDLPEGSAEWELLFRKYYDEELKKVRRVRE